MSLFSNTMSKLFGTHSEREIKTITPQVDKIEAMADTYRRMSEAELKGQTELLKQRLAQGETLDDILPEAFAAIREAALSCPGVLPDPEPMIWMSKHGDSALEYTLRVTCLREDYFPVLMGMNEIVKRSFDRAGISIPFPQMDVHFDRER